MFFFLSKTLNFFTMPLVIICILLLLSLFLRSQLWRTWLARTGIILLLFCANDFIANEFLLAWEIPATPLADIKKQYTWGIILCGVVKSDTEPNDRVYFQRGADRVTHTVQLYKAGIIKKILVSGGVGRLFNVGEPEADVIARVLVMMGVPPGDILTENQSRNTHESAVELKKMLADSVKQEECLLITSAFHMRRSRACFAKVGLTLDTFSTDFLSHKRKFSIDGLLIPKVEAVVHWHVLMKEWVGFVAYTLAGYV